MRRVLWFVVILSTEVVDIPGQTLVDLRSQTRNVDFSGALSTKPFQAGVNLPLTCSPGQAYLNLSALPGQNLYICTVTNTWTVQAPPALPGLTGNAGKVLSNDGANLQWRGLSGDLSGSPDAAIVTQMQGRPLNPSAPLQGQLLRWLGAQWGPSTESVSTVFGRSGTVAPQTGDYAFPQITGVLSLTQGGTGATSASGALVSIGAAPAVHTHVLTDLIGITGKQGTAGTIQMFGGGTVNTNDCAKFDANGDLTTAGMPCGPMPNYGQSFTSATSVTLTHNLNSTDLLVQCYDTTQTATGFNSFAASTANTATVTFLNPQSGRCVLSASAGSASGSGSSSVVTGLGLAGAGTTASPLSVDTTAVPTRLTGTNSLTWLSFAQSTCQELTITLTGAVTGDEVMLGAPATIDQGFQWGGYVSSANTVTVRMCKITAGTVTPVSNGLSWRATIIKAL